MFKTIGLLVISSLSGLTHGSTMIYGESSKIDSFEPYTSHEVAAKRLTDLLFDNLITTSPSGAYKGELAESWVVNSSSTSVVVNLRKNVLWHSKEKEEKYTLSPEDVITTINLIKNSESEIPNRDRYNALKYAKKKSDSVVEIFFNRALSDPLRLLMFKILPHHKLKDSISLKRSSSFVKSPTGTGPYQLNSHSKQGEVHLKANSNYFKGKPQISNIIMKPYTDQNVMAQSLMYNSLDLITYVSPRNLPEVLEDKKLGIIPYDALSFTFFAMNNRKKFFSDKKVRQAISYAVNREEMMKAFFSNRGTLITGPFPPTSWAYNLNVKGYSHNPQRSKDLLIAAGYKYSKDGALLSNKKRVEIDFAVPIGNEGETIKRIALAFSSYLDKVGIKTNLKFMDWLVWKEKVLKSHNFDVTIGSWSFDDASNITSLFHSGYSGPWGNNFVGFSNPEIDLMLNEAQATNDFEKRRAIYKKLHATLAEEAPYSYLWTLMHHAAHQVSISNIRVEPDSFFKSISQWSKGDRRSHGKQ